MTGRQSIWYHMVLAVITYLQSIAAIIVKPAIILTTLDLIKAKVSEIDNLESGMGEVTAGKTVNKNTLRHNLEAVTFNIAASLHSYALANNIADLAENTSATESKFSAMREDKLYNEAIQVNNLAVANAASLDDYDITPEEVTAHKTLAEDYKTSLGETGSSRKLSTEETAKLERLYAELLALIEEEDKHLTTLKLKKPEIYGAYFAARKLVNTGVRHEAKEEIMPPAEEVTPQ
ncbi:MAG TPA: hypothetical protein VJ954_03725 [Ignavibacteriaceae bacterium]|nr:hypothetical protein [Ignavibacteriaceae bacterium]